MKTYVTSSQEGGIGRYTLPPHTTKRTTTNLKTKTNQNCQKIELYGSPTTGELKKKHSSRPGGGVEMVSWGREDSRQGSSWRTRAREAAPGRPGEVAAGELGEARLVDWAVLYLHADKPGGTTGE